MEQVLNLNMYTRRSAVPVHAVLDVRYWLEMGHCVQSGIWRKGVFHYGFGSLKFFLMSFEISRSLVLLLLFGNGAPFYTGSLS